MRKVLVATAFLVLSAPVCAQDRPSPAADKAQAMADKLNDPVMQAALAGGLRSLRGGDLRRGHLPQRGDGGDGHDRAAGAHLPGGDVALQPLRGPRTILGGLAGHGRAAHDHRLGGGDGAALQVAGQQLLAAGVLGLGGVGGVHAAQPDQLVARGALRHQLISQGVAHVRQPGVAAHHRGGLGQAARERGDLGVLAARGGVRQVGRSLAHDALFALAQHRGVGAQHGARVIEVAHAGREVHRAVRLWAVLAEVAVQLRGLQRVADGGAHCVAVIVSVHSASLHFGC